jgi:hypothetical protein
MGELARKARAVDEATRSSCKNEPDPHLPPVRFVRELMLGESTRWRGGRCTSIASSRPCREDATSGCMNGHRDRSYDKGRRSNANSPDRIARFAELRAPARSTDAVLFRTSAAISGYHRSGAVIIKRRAA